MNKSVDALYIHVPFCVRKCAYCDFHSIPAESGNVDSYLDALEKEVAARSSLAGKLRTVFIGGGTPTSLSAGQLARLLKLVQSHFDVSGVAEWTVEANPGTVDAEKLRLMLANGVNRLSIGAQSFQAATLKLLGRIHSAGEIGETMRLARKCGFGNISLDLISGVPGTSLDSWKDDLQHAIGLAPEHISAYCLSYEEGTPLKLLRLAGNIESLPEEAEADMYNASIDTLEAAGYGQYEISNYALPGRECMHNIVYWENGEYLGLGPSAVSYIGGERRRNLLLSEGYAEMPLLESETETLTPEERAGETAIMNLRLRSGVREKDFFERTGFIFSELFVRQIDMHLRNGSLERTAEGYCLSRAILPLADSVMCDFVILSEP